VQGRTTSASHTERLVGVPLEPWSNSRPR